jgi:hypothetical protein
MDIGPLKEGGSESVDGGMKARLADMDESDGTSVQRPSHLLDASLELGINRYTQPH